MVVASQRVKECLLEPLRRTTRDLFGVVIGIWAGDRLAGRADHVGADGEHSTSTADGDQVCAADRRQLTAPVVTKVHVVAATIT